MYRFKGMRKTSLGVNESREGETIEMKIERIVNNKEPITDGAPIVFTERKDGVRPEFDIRTDRFEIAIDAMNKVTKSNLAKRDAKIAEREAELKKLAETQKPNDGGAEPTQGTN